jgi:hypothetical protein
VVEKLAAEWKVVISMKMRGLDYGIKDLLVPYSGLRARRRLDIRVEEFLGIDPVKGHLSRVK